MPSKSNLLVAAVTLAATASAAVFELPIWIDNTYAVVEVEAGTPPVKHFLEFDTGSSTLWMVDAWCAPSACPNDSGFARAGYNVSASSTGKSTSIFGDIDYLGGDVAGWVAYDSFSIPGSPIKWNQTFLDTYQSNFIFQPDDGFLGLAFSTIAVPQTETLVETLMQKHLLDLPRFAIYYGKNTTSTNNKPGLGQLTIGGSLEALYAEGPLTWVPIEKTGSDYEVWRSGMQSVTGHRTDKHGKTTSTTTGTPDSWAVFDTGAGQVAVPPSQIDAIYASIGMNYSAILSGQVLPLCTDFNSSWSVSFQFGASPANTVTITGEQLKRPGFAYGDSFCFPPFDDSGVEGFFLVGQPFLDQFYTVFDFGSFEPSRYAPRVGFGKLWDWWKPGH